MRSAADPVLSRATGGWSGCHCADNLCGLLAACSGTTLPFSKASDVPSWRAAASGGRRRHRRPPGRSGSALVDALVRAGAQRGIAVGRVEVEDGHALTGAVRGSDWEAGTAIRYRWTLTDPTGRVLHRIEESETAPLPVGEAWAGVDGDVVRRIAAYTAESLSSRFSQLGYATRAAGLPPPLDHMVQAGPDAENEIDYETLYGPNRTAMSDPSAGSQAPLPEHVAAGPSRHRQRFPLPSRKLGPRDPRCCHHRRQRGWSHRQRGTAERPQIGADRCRLAGRGGGPRRRAGDPGRRERRPRRTARHRKWRCAGP
jgi:hypothetical protein